MTKPKPKAVAAPSPAAAKPSRPANHSRAKTPQIDEPAAHRPAVKPVELETVVVVNARCIRPSCCSTDVKPVAGLKPDVTVGNTTVRGLPVTHIVRTRMICNTCGQRFQVVEHQNRPGAK